MTRYTVKHCPLIKKWWVRDNREAQLTVAFKLKREALAQAREWNVEENLADTVEAHEIEIVHCGLTEKRDEIGIHLTNPYGSEIAESLHRAERDLFPTVFCHWSNVVRLPVRGAT